MVGYGERREERESGVIQKLEEEKHNKNKGLTLDPHKNHLHLYEDQNQNQFIPTSTNVIEERQLEEQQLFHQNQLLYGTRLDSHHHHHKQLPPPPPPKKRAYFSPSSSLEPTSEHALLREKMAESSHRQPMSRLGGKAAVGEIVEVQGGHIVRSTGRKDRHSKVCTAKGPRDRRVRLAAHTAIQFYDVQDRLGYDRPSKAVDWLIKKAKAAIDELAQLPAWHPASCQGPNACFEPEDPQQKLLEEQRQQSDLVNSDASGHSSKRAVTMAVEEEEDDQQDLHHRGIGSNSNPQISSFLPPSMDSDSIADTIKSFFPMGASGEATSSSMQFQSFSNPDLMRRSSSHSQDLRLSLQSFQDPIMLPHQPHQSSNHHAAQARPQARVLLSGTPVGFEGTSAGGWAEHHQFQRLPPWNAGADTASSAASAGFFFNSPPAPQPLLQQLLGHNQLFSQRGPLQSSNIPSVRAWIDPSAAAVDHGQQLPHHHPGAFPVYPSSVPGFGYGGFTGFHIPARIQGDEEDHDGYSDKPSSASSDSRH